MTNERINIYCKSRFNYENDEKNLAKENISEVNKNLIRKYINNLFSNNVTPQRCKKINCNLRTVCKILQKDLDKLDKEDIINTFVKIKSDTKHAEATKEGFILAVKQFFKWFEDEDERLYDNDPMVRRKVTMMYKQLRNTKMKMFRKKINPSDILTDEDIKEVLRYCFTVRDKTFIRLLHETGARAGEFLNIRIKHVIFENDGRAKIHLDGKTGERRIPIVYSVALLRQLIDEHPHRDDDNSILWWTMNSSNHDHSLLHQGASKMIRYVWDRLPEKSPVKRKEHNMHFFRHSRATLLAPKMTESLLCKYMGWTLASRQVKTYVHLSPDDLDDAYFGKMGLDGEKKIDKSKPKICQFCNAINDMINDYCHRCGRPLDLDTAIREDLKIEKQKNETYEILTELMKSPDFIKFAKEKGFNV